MRAHFLLVVLVALLALTGSVFLIPSTGEIALMRYKDGDFTSALAEYQKRLREGDHSPQVVMALSRLYLHYGRIGPALTLIDGYVAEHPDDLEGLKILGTYQRYATLYDSYLVTLEAIARLSPQENTLRELADLYAFHGRYADQIRTLAEMLSRYKGHPQDYETLAKLQAAAGHFAAAAATLRRLKAAFPQAMDINATGLLVSLLLDDGQPAQAQAQAQAWLAAHPRIGDAAWLAGQFGERRQSRLGLTLLAPFAAQADANPALLLELVGLELNAGEYQSAFDRLHRLWRAKVLPPSGRVPLIQAALALNRPADAFAVLPTPDALAQLPDWLQEGLADAALAGRDRSHDALLAAGLAPAFLQDHPGLAAQLALNAGDRTKALRWALAAMNQPGLSIGQTLRLVKVLDRLGQASQSLVLLDRAAQAPDLPDSALGDLAQRYLALGHIDDGLARFERLRERRPGAAADAGWALLATAAGRTDAVLAWLDHPAHGAPAADLLTTLYYVAGDHHQSHLAVALAQRLLAATPTDAARFDLADALLRDNRPEEALPLLRRLDLARPAIAADYGAALLAAAKAGPPVRDEAVTFWRAQARSTDQKRRQDAVYALLDLKDYAGAAPVLAQLVHQDPSQWRSAYWDTLTRLGRTDALAAALLAQGQDPKTAAKTRRDIAFRLLAMRHKAEATRIFRALADREGPQGPDVSQLLYLWGPRPDASALAWITARARAADDADLPGWSRRLIDVGEPARAAELIGGRPRSATDPALAAAWLQALGAIPGTPDKAAWGRALTAMVLATRDPTRLDHLGRLALEVGLNPLAEKAYGKALRQRPEDGAALAALGRLAFARNDAKAARHWLEAAVQAGHGDPESLLDYGEVLLGAGERRAAQAQYAKALALIEKAKGPVDPGMAAMRAMLLYRLGRNQEAIAAYEALLRQHPGDANLKADFASMLIDLGDLKRAATLLSPEGAKHAK